ncbi:hypothetical protein KL930_002742 [Ogataea haglerorum]|nr:hypothetical protein KL930_002742 [Ogataea haglerorum]KAG7779341.1 hypothetical protein KL922_001826 [Ogataea haglerorum]
MVKFRNYALDLGYPIYGAKFLSDKILVVAGGGGEGNNGIPNKITALLIQPQNSKKPIKRYRELVLNEQEDCPMSLDANNNQILVGINENSESIRRGVNKHLRKFKYHNDHLKFVESCQIHPGNNPQHYQKLTKMTKDATLGVIAMSDEPSSLYIVDMSGDLEEKFKIVTVGDVKDISISPDGKMMCYITSSHFEAISTVTGRSIFKSKINFWMSKIEFYDNNMVIIAGSSKTGVMVGKFSIAKSAVTKTTLLAKALKGVTSLDTNSQCGLIALGGSDCSVLLVRSHDLKLLKKLDKVHGFAITRVVFSENGEYLASVSAANTVNIIELPSKLVELKPLYLSLFQVLSSIIVACLIAFALQYLHVNGYIHQIQTKAVEYYRSKQLTDSSHYFTIQPIASSEVFPKGPLSTTICMPSSSYVSNLPTDNWTEEAHRISEPQDMETSEYTFLKPVKTLANNMQNVCSSVTRSLETNGHEKQISLKTEPEISGYQNMDFLTTSGESESEVKKSTKTLTVVETVLETQTSIIRSTQISTSIATVLTTDVQSITEIVYLTPDLNDFSINVSNSVLSTKSKPRNWDSIVSDSYVNSDLRNAVSDGEGELSSPSSNIDPIIYSTESMSLTSVQDAPQTSKHGTEEFSHDPFPSFHKGINRNEGNSEERLVTSISDEHFDDPKIQLDNPGPQTDSVQSNLQTLNLVLREGQGIGYQNRTPSVINDYATSMTHEGIMIVRLTSSMAPEITADVKHFANSAISKTEDYQESSQEPEKLDLLLATQTKTLDIGGGRQTELELSKKPYTLHSVLPKALENEDIISNDFQT